MSRFKTVLVVFVALLLVGGFVGRPELDAGPRVSQLAPNSLSVCLDVADVNELADATMLDMKTFRDKLDTKVSEGKCRKFPHPLAYLRSLRVFKTVDGATNRVVELFWPDHPQEKFYTFVDDLPPGVIEIDWKPGIFDQAGVMPDGTPKFFPMTEEERLWFQDSFVTGCCNIGDAFISDYFFEKDGKYYAEITDGYDHHPQVLKGIIKPGTIREIPEAIMKKMQQRNDKGELIAPRNPTSHGIIFLHLYHNAACNCMIGVGGRTNNPEDAEVLCYWPPSLN